MLFCNAMKIDEISLLTLIEILPQPTRLYCSIFFFTCTIFGWYSHMFFLFFYWQRSFLFFLFYSVSRFDQHLVLHIVLAKACRRAISMIPYRRSDLINKAMKENMMIEHNVDSFFSQLIIWSDADGDDNHCRQSYIISIEGGTCSSLSCSLDQAINI